MFVLARTMLEDVLERSSNGVGCLYWSAHFYVLIIEFVFN